MPTLLHATPPVHRVRCRDCGRCHDAEAGSRWCESCEAARDASLALQKLIAGDDAALIRRAAEWLELFVSDAAVFRSARAGRILDHAALEAVRQVRDPILDRDDADEFEGRN